MGKEKIEEKDVRLLRYAVEQAFDGAMRALTAKEIEELFRIIRQLRDEGRGIGTVEPSGRFGFGSGKS